MTRSQFRPRLALAILLVVYVGLAVAYSLVNPLYEAPDELRHVRYVRHISAYRSLPVQRAGAPRAQSHHPPLYYALGALVSGWVDVEDDVYYQPVENPFWAYRYWEVGNDNKNQYLHGPTRRLGPLSIPRMTGITLVVYLVRWITVLVGAGVVWLTYRIGVHVFPERPGLAVGGAALVAFNPQFLYLSGAVNNDVPAALWGAAVLLVSLDVLSQGPRLATNILLGVLFGLAMLTKIHLVVLFVPIVLAHGMALWRDRDWRDFLRTNIIVIGLALLVSGWWFARNQMLYGDPLGASVHSQLWNSRSPSDGWWALRQELPYLWSTLWGRFGYGQVALPSLVYHGLLVFCGVSLAGYLVPRDRSLRSRPAGLLVSTVAVFVAWVLFYTLVQPAGARGRFLFPALPAFGMLTVGGLQRFSPFRNGWLTTAITGVGMAALALYALGCVLAPAFSPPRPLSEPQIQAVPNPVGADFRSSHGSPDGAVVKMLGHQVAPVDITPGDAVEVTVYWKVMTRTEQNHVVFVHLMSETGVIIAQRDTYPGLGRYPTSVWDPGTVFADTYRIHVPETAYAPDHGYVQVGLYVPDGPRLTTEGGEDALQLASVEVHPRPGDVPNPMELSFGDKVALVGYSLDQRVVQPGETIGLTLHWLALNPMDVNYDVFVHVLGAENQIWGNTNSPLTDRAVCTNRWKPGTLVREERELTVSEGTPAGFYDLELGLHSSPHGRLKVLNEEGRPVANRMLLTKIRVTNGDR